MNMSQYEVRFQELSRYAIAILPSEEERIHYFMQGLRPQLRMGTHALVTSGRSFLDIIDHSRSLEQISREAKGAGTSRPKVREGSVASP